MDNKVVVDAFDFICITHETEWSQCKAKRRYPNTNEIEYQHYKLGGVVDPRVVDTRLRFRDIARIGRPMK